MTASQNDNAPLDPPGVPDWAWDIIERHDLIERADSPLAAAIVLLTDAAYDLRELSTSAFRDQALTSDVRTRGKACTAMVEDALRLAELCASVPTRGVVTCDNDTLTWCQRRAVGRSQPTTLRLGPFSRQQRCDLGP